MRCCILPNHHAVYPQLRVKEANRNHTAYYPDWQLRPHPGFPNKFKEYKRFPPVPAAPPWFHGFRVIIPDHASIALPLRSSPR